MAHSEFQIAVHDRVNSLSGDWPDADDRGGAALFVFQSKSFLRAWEASYGAAHKARLCMVELRGGDGRPLLFVPLCILRRHGARILTFMDDGVADYNAPILFADTPDWSESEVRAVMRRIFAALPPFDIASFQKMPPEIEGRPNPLRHIAERACEADAHWITLDRPLPDIEASIRGFRTVRKRAKALGAISGFRFAVAGSEEERAHILAAMIRQKQRRFEETDVPGFDAHPEKRRFFELATGPLAAIGAVHLSALTVGDEVIASMWSVTRGGHYCAMITTFEQGEWSRYSPGKAILAVLIDTLKAEGYRCLDIGFGNEPWKRDFADRTIALRDHLAAHSLRGRLSLGAQQAVARLRATWLYGRLRPLKWQILRRLRR